MPYSSTLLHPHHLIATACASTATAPRALFLHSTFVAFTLVVVVGRRVVLAKAELNSELNKWLFFVAHFHSRPPTLPPPVHTLTLRKVLFPLHCHTSSHVLSSVYTLMVGFVRLVGMFGRACSSELTALSIYTCFGCGLSPAFTMRMTTHTHSH